MKKLCFFAFALFFNHIVVADGVNLINKNINCSNTYSLCQICKKNENLFPLNQFSNSEDSLEIIADNSEITDKAEYQITGNVVVKSSENFLSADKVIISKENKTSTAIGSVNYQDDKFLLTGSTLVVKKIGENLLVDVDDAKYQELETKANGTALKVTKNNDQAILENSTYSFCPIDNSDWKINAKSIKLDLKNNRAVATKATLEFLGFPLMYLPKYSWVTSGRGSGFLSPGLNIYKESGENHLYSRIPYYFNLAPDRDLLITLSYPASRGMLYAGKYRQLILNKNKDDGIFELETQYLFDDKIRKTSRWLIDSSIELEVNNNTHLSMKYNKVSDSEYLNEVAKVGSSKERLKSFIKLQINNPPLPEEKNSGKLNKKKIASVNYGRNTIDNNKSLNQTSLIVSSENEQVVNNGAPDYTKSLEAAFFLRKNGKEKLPSFADIGLILSNFNHKTSGKDTGLRTHGEINISKSLGSLKSLTSSQLSASGRASLTNYTLDNKSNKTRAYGGLNLDLSFPFSRSGNLFGKAIINNIRPSISYDFSSRHKLSAIPIFDTEDTISNILTYSSLRSGDRYIGVDRVINKNDITLSLRSSFIDIKKPNNTRLDFKVAQRYYLDDETVSISNSSDFEKRRKFSDIAASIDFSLDDFDKLKSSFKIQYDPESSEIKKNELSITYRLHPKNFFTASLADDGSTKSLNVSGAYPVTNRIHIFAGIDRSITAGVNNKETTGIAFEDCCWSARLAHFKEAFVDDVAKYDYSTGFELTFKGLGSSDTNLRNHIKRNLPEYKANLSEVVKVLSDPK